MGADRPTTTGEERRRAMQEGGGREGESEANDLAKVEVERRERRERRWSTTWRKGVTSPR